jgi:hypothetical protein
VEGEFVITERYKQIPGGNDRKKCKGNGSGGRLVAGDGGVDLGGPGVDAAGDGLGLVEALLAEPRGYGERAGAVVAEDEDRGFFVELLVGAAGDLVHGEEGAAFDVRGVEFPLLADVEKEGRVFGGEEGFGLGDGEF